MVMMMSVRIALLPLIIFLVIHKVVCDDDKSSEENKDKEDDDDDDDVHQDSSSLYAVFVIAVVCVVLLLICIVLLLRQRKKAGVSNDREIQVQDPSRHVYENDSFVNVSLKKTDEGQTPQPTDPETVEYATILENQQLQPDSALRETGKCEKAEKVLVMMISVRVAFLSLILLMIHKVVCFVDADDDKWGVKYTPLHICALKSLTVIMRCTYKYPRKHKVMTAFWTNNPPKQGQEFPDLSVDPEYSQRLQYLRDEQQNDTIRLSHVTKKDEHQYYFRFTTNVTGGVWIGIPGVRLSVTDLQLESPERVTEGDSVRLTCKSSCELTDTPTFIWYRNSERLTERRQKRDRSNELVLRSVRREDAGRYSCGVDGHTLTSPEVYLNVTYPPKSVSVSISGSAVIMEGDSVTLNCSSDSNPPAEINWFKEKTPVGSGRIFSSSKISSDDSGEYKCRARNDHGVKYSDPVTLDVQYSPKSVSVSLSGSAVIVEGDSVTLSCSSDSNPPAEINWYKGNQSLNSGRIFSISKISSDDSGEYKCKARNAHGVKYSDPVTLDVQLPKRQDFSINAAFRIGAACAVLLLVCVLLFISTRKKAGVSNNRQNQVQDPPRSSRDIYENDSLVNVSPNRTDQTS